MGREHFFKVTGLEEDFIERVREDESEETLIPLLYTKSGIRKVCEEIKTYTEKAKGIRNITVDAGYDYDIKDFKWTEELNRDLGPDLEYFGIKLEFESWLGRKLDRVYPCKEYKEYTIAHRPNFNPDYIEIGWWLVPQNRRYWYVILSGRPTCAKNFRKAIIDDPNFHELCASPKEYKEICGNLTTFLKKHAIKYKEK